MAKKVRSCIDCGVTDAETAISKNLRCGNCFYKRMLASSKQMREKKGPFYDKWKQGIRLHAEKLLREE